MTPQTTGIAILLAAVAVESGAQLCLKIGTAPGRRRWVATGIAALGVEIALYTAALHLLEVSVAFPVASLSFVGVALLSRVFLGEAVGRVRWIGVGCIVAGAALVAL